MVLPFFETSPMLSSKQADFEKFARIVRAMAVGRHRSPHGFSELLQLAVSMNGGGRYRQYRWLDVIGSDPESSETVRQTGSCTGRYSPSCMATCRVRQKCPGPQPHVEAVGSNKTVGPYLPWALES
jgi:hypothetical protein